MEVAVWSLEMLHFVQQSFDIIRDSSCAFVCLRGSSTAVLAFIQADFDNPGRDLRSRGETQLKQDIGHVRFDRALADH